MPFLPILYAAPRRRSLLGLCLGAALATSAPLPAQSVSVPVEPFFGRLRYANELAQNDQNVVGLRVGFDLNQRFGIRGFAWQGVNEEFRATQDVRAYGAEAQIGLLPRTAVFPYVVAGAGRVEYTPGDSLAVDLLPDRTAFILGGGLSVQLSDRSRLNLAARDYLFSRDDLGVDTGEGNLLNNPLLSASVTFALGSDPRGRADERRLREEVEQLRRENRQLRTASAAGVVRVDTVFTPEGEVLLRTDSVRGTITIPIPAQGEINLRYGAAPAAPPASAGVTGAEIRALIREELGRDLALPGAAPVAPGELEALERRLAARIDALLAARAQGGDRDVLVLPGQPGAPPTDLALLDQRLDAIERRLTARLDELVERRVQRAQPRGNLAGPPADSTVLPRDEDGGSDLFGRFNYSLQGTQLYTGINIDDPTQALVGARFDLGPITPRSPLDLVGELAFGLGESDPTLLVTLNSRLNFGSLGGETRIDPYLTAGFGVFSKTALTLNFGYGANFNVRFRDQLWRAFAEHQGLNLYNRNRLLLGVNFIRF